MAASVIDEQLFDRIADSELNHLENSLSECDPDELELSNQMGVLKIELADGVVVVNSHRAARQIWMAAFRQAWHFSPEADGDQWKWKTHSGEELRGTLGRLLGERLHHPVKLW